MPFVESKTDRTTIVSSLIGPEGPPLKGADYTAWLDRAGWKDNGYVRLEAEPATTDCEQCGRSFASLRSTARFCSPTCRQAARRQAAVTLRGTNTLVRAS